MCTVQNLHFRAYKPQKELTSTRQGLCSKWVITVNYMYFLCDGEAINNSLSDIPAYLNNAVKYKIIEKTFFFMFYL